MALDAKAPQPIANLRRVNVMKLVPVPHRISSCLLRRQASYASEFMRVIHCNGKTLLQQRPSSAVIGKTVTRCRRVSALPFHLQLCAALITASASFRAVGDGVPRNCEKALANVHTHAMSPRWKEAQRSGWTWIQFSLLANNSVSFAIFTAVQRADRDVQINALHRHLILQWKGSCLFVW
jgi:hypothetical protein